MSLEWSYGVTSCPHRLDTLLPRTLASLRLGGFDDPVISIDGPKPDFKGEYPAYLKDHEVIKRPSLLRTMGNWWLLAVELYVRKPKADRFVIFQDDFVTYVNLRRYLELCEYKNKQYYNMYSFPSNTKKRLGWNASNQCGRGAVALMFDNVTLRTLLASDSFIKRPMNADRGWRSVDGGIITALRKKGWKEMCHTPSLVQHTGIKSSMGNRRQPLAPTEDERGKQGWRGEDYDALLIPNEINKWLEDKGLLQESTQ